MKGWRVKSICVAAEGNGIKRRRFILDMKDGSMLRCEQLNVRRTFMLSIVGMEKTVK